MIFEGLWEGFKWPEGTVLRTFTIVTTNANLIMAELHDRMSAILEPQDLPTWLGEVGRPSVRKVWPVSKQVNSPRNNGAAELLRLRRSA